MNEDNMLSTLIDARIAYKDDERLTNFGHEMFRMYTEAGFPPDMFLAEIGKRIKLDLLAKVYITTIYQTDFLEHRRLSGIQEKNINKLRRQNRNEIERLIKSGELGIY